MIELSFQNVAALYQLRLHQNVNVYFSSTKEAKDLCSLCVPLLLSLQAWRAK